MASAVFIHVLSRAVPSMSEESRAIKGGVARISIRWRLASRIERRGSARVTATSITSRTASEREPFHRRRVNIVALLNSFISDTFSPAMVGPEGPSLQWVLRYGKTCEFGNVVESVVEAVEVFDLLALHRCNHDSIS